MSLGRRTEGGGHRCGRRLLRAIHSSHQSSLIPANPGRRFEVHPTCPRGGGRDCSEKRGAALDGRRPPRSAAGGAGCPARAIRSIPYGRHRLRPRTMVRCMARGGCAIIAPCRSRASGPQRAETSQAAARRVGVSPSSPWPSPPQGGEGSRRSRHVLSPLSNGGGDPCPLNHVPPPPLGEGGQGENLVCATPSARLSRAVVARPVESHLSHSIPANPACPT